jgi:hypothetical protein
MMKQDASEVAPSGLVEVVRPMTALERIIAERVRDGLDPWRGGYKGRVVSQALARLKRKHFIRDGFIRRGEWGYRLTELGESWVGRGKDRRR